MVSDPINAYIMQSRTIQLNFEFYHLLHFLFYLHDETAAEKIEPEEAQIQKQQSHQCHSLFRILYQ